MPESSYNSGIHQMVYGKMRKGRLGCVVMSLAKQNPSNKSLTSNIANKLLSGLEGGTPVQHDHSTQHMDHRR